MAEKMKNVSIKLPLSLWKKVKILSVHNECTIEVVIREMVERQANTKKVESIVGDESQS